MKPNVVVKVTALAAALCGSLALVPVFQSEPAVAAATSITTKTVGAPADTTYLVALPDFSKLVEDYGKAVVSIDSVTKARRAPAPDRNQQPDPFEEFRRFGFPFQFGPIPQGPRNIPERRGQGSGFIISPDGLILTNHHVVEGADELTVHLPDKRVFKAKLIGSDQKTDVAVIKVDAKNLPTVKLGSSDKVKVGEWVAAIGAPFGLDNTVTQGIVSAKSRNLEGDQFVPFIQTDVAVNPGNSGGPLFNLRGEVIGINSQIFSTSGGFMGLSFAIPIDLAVQIKDQLVKGGKVHRGRIGVVMQPLTPELAESLGLPNASGALVVQLEEKGPAQKAGMQEGDLIVEFNGTPIADSNDLSRAVANTKPNSKVNVKVKRGVKEVSLNLKVEELTAEPMKIASAKSGGSYGTQVNALGVVTRSLNAAEKKKVKDGLFVTAVMGRAAEAGIQAGDIILSVAGQKVKSEADLDKATAKAKGTIAVLVDRSGQRIFVPVKFS
ncbi:MAG: Do family serine endopeptidase [Burkholderiales bacterium]|nr:Do family serine endopeptidase [Burkholderiales bacterium]